jgi:hypothetical protein
MLDRFDAKLDGAFDPVDRDRLIGALRAVLPGDRLIVSTESMRPYESDGLAAYRSLPAAVALPIPPVPPVTRTVWPAIGPGDRSVIAFLFRSAWGGGWRFGYAAGADGGSSGMGNRDDELSAGGPVGVFMVVPLGRYR